MNNKEIFDPKNLTISDIFTFTGIYTIPNYQRQYTWGDEHLEELDDEIKNYHIIPILPLLAETTVINGYGYRKIDGIKFNLYSPSQFNEERLNTFLNTMKKYYNFEQYLTKI